MKFTLYTKGNIFQSPLFQKKAFTLVELIIVITILAILATIAFMSFQGYMKQSRDAVRVSDLASASKGLSIFFTKSGVYPEAESPVTITASGNTLSSQGTLGESVVRAINMNQVPLDPVDQSKYTYSTNGTKTKYQLMSYTEGSELVSYVSESYAGEYEEKGIKLVGDEIGIILNSDNSPITTGIDVFTTTGSYKAYVNKEITFHGTGVVLADLSDIPIYKKLLELPTIAKNYKVLVIYQQTDESYNKLKNHYLNGGYQVEVQTGATTLEKIAQYKPDIIVCDQNWFKCNSPVLNEAYQAGYAIASIGNDTSSGVFIKSIIQSNTTGGIVQPTSLAHFISRGWTGTTGNYNDGRQLITSLSGGAISIAQDSVTHSNDVVYMEEVGKGRRIHFQLSYLSEINLFNRANAYLLR